MSYYINWINYLLDTRYLFRSRAVTNRIFYPKRQIFSMRAQNILSFHHVWPLLLSKLLNDSEVSAYNTLNCISKYCLRSLLNRPVFLRGAGIRRSSFYFHVLFTWKLKHIYAKTWLEIGKCLISSEILILDGS